jgi:hypothetical protein
MLTESNAGPTSGATWPADMIRICKRCLISPIAIRDSGQWSSGIGHGHRGSGVAAAGKSRQDGNVSPGVHVRLLRDDLFSAGLDVPGSCCAEIELPVGIYQLVSVVDRQAPEHRHQAVIGGYRVRTDEEQQIRFGAVSRGGRPFQYLGAQGRGGKNIRRHRYLIRLKDHAGASAFEIYGLSGIPQPAAVGDDGVGTGGILPGPFGAFYQAFEFSQPGGESFTRELPLCDSIGVPGLLLGPALFLGGQVLTGLFRGLTSRANSLFFAA